ncbi:MAG TPA: hypothetical protein PLY32_04800 [Salinivirgaceae bacterium]|nr:hypothetical protein [Salinivirgaceae bacterium]HQA76420.1 hypothetical protein [Salinivirgaceae bacterium]
MGGFIIASAQNESGIEQVFFYGSLAPSSHNAQMWNIIKVGDQEYKIEIDTKHKLSCVDPADREAWISIGAFLQNCLYAAPFFGYAINYKIESNAVYLSFLPTQECTTLKKTFDITLEDLKKRHTCRKNYSKKKIAPEIVAPILNGFQNTLYIDANSDLGTKLSTLIVDANIKQYQQKQTVKELSSLILTDKKGKGNRRGLTLEAMGLSAFERFFFRLFFSNADLTKNKIFLSGAVKTAKSQVSNCSGYLILFSKGEAFPKDEIMCGMDLVAIWTLLNKSGVSVHPMSQPQEEHPAELSELFPNANKVQMILRIGYGANCHNIKERAKINIIPNE